MNNRSINAAIATILLTLCHAAVTWSQDDGLLSRAVDFQGSARSYYVGLPHDFDPDQTYWPLVVVHGGGGHARANSKAAALRRFAHEADLPAILIQPEFITEDKQVSRFPILGEDEFLEAVLMQASAEFKLHRKMLLTGYSMGGQFSHRFALANPQRVQACAAFAAGTWSTPDGRLLIESYGEVKQPEVFLSCRENAAKVPERLHDLFDERTAKVAGRPAANTADQVPFLVMCGTVNTRFGIAVKFANSLHEAGFMVETEWPMTPHGAGSAQYASEFEKFPKHAIRFFQTHTASVR